MRELALAAFGVGVSWVAYTYVGYPLVLWLIGFIVRVRPQKRKDYLPIVSILIAARNEERDIEWKVRETLAWDYPADRLEVLVASDASDDRTDEIVQAIDDLRVKLVRMQKRGGKGRALNRLAELARGELLFFTDANAHIAPHVLRNMAAHFADMRVGCVTGGTQPIGADQQAIGSGASSFLGYESILYRMESRIGSVLACDGAIFCIRRSLYTPVSPEIANDLELPLRIRHAGFWILHEPSAVARETDTSSPGEEFARRRRICAQGMLTMSQLRVTLGGLRGWQFLSHKLLRYLTLVPLLLVLFSAAVLWREPLFAVILMLQAMFYGAALYGYVSTLLNWKSGRLSGTPFYIVFGSVGAVAGIVDACRGRRFDVWEIPKLSRGKQDAPAGPAVECRAAAPGKR
jgi:cellulose synthase/poly-beta-1,6-N-acetylglucosamine synthase-like glycosyltransferase